MQRDRLLTGVKWLLRGLSALNIVMAVGILIAFVALFVFEGQLGVRLIGKYGADFAVAATIMAMRLLALLTLVVTGAAQAIFTSLLRMLATVEAGDPFTAVNAARLQTIGWALLVIQLVDLGFGAIMLWLVKAGADIGTSWQPSLMGWLAVLLMFVLARVFKTGARMRDEIEGTI